MTPRGRISALQEAWQDELFAEPYADLPPGERQVRDDAFKELLQDALGAVLDVGLDLDDQSGAIGSLRARRVREDVKVPNDGRGEGS